MVSCTCYRYRVFSRLDLQVVVIFSICLPPKKKKKRYIEKPRFSLLSTNNIRFRTYLKMFVLRIVLQSVLSRVRHTKVKDILRFYPY